MRGGTSRVGGLRGYAVQQRVGQEFSDDRRGVVGALHNVTMAERGLDRIVGMHQRECCVCADELLKLL